MTSESQLKGEIQRGLRAHPHCVDMVTNHGGLLGGKYRCAPDGWPDTTVTWCFGLTFYIEWKAKGGRVSPAQHKCHRTLRAAGHLVIVAPKTTGEIVEQINSHLKGVV